MLSAAYVERAGREEGEMKGWQERGRGKKENGEKTDKSTLQSQHVPIIVALKARLKRMSVWPRLEGEREREREREREQEKEYLLFPGRFAPAMSS